MAAVRLSLSLTRPSRQHLKPAQHNIDDHPVVELKAPAPTKDQVSNSLSTARTGGIPMPSQGLPQVRRLILCLPTPHHAVMHPS